MSNSLSVFILGLDSEKVGPAAAPISSSSFSSSSLRFGRMLHLPTLRGGVR